MIRRTVDLAEALFGGERPLAECGKLVAKATNKGLELPESLELRMCVV